MKSLVSTTSGGLTQAETQAAMEAAIVAQRLDLKDTKFHDCAVTNIPALSGTPVEIDVAVPVSTPIKELQVTCTFGEPIEILTGTSLLTATRKFILNLGDGPIVMPCKLSVGDHLYVRTLSANAVTSGVLSINLMG